MKIKYIFWVLAIALVCGIAFADDTQMFGISALSKDLNGYQPAQFNDTLQQYYNQQYYNDTSASFYRDFGDRDISVFQNLLELYNKTDSYNVTEVYTNATGSENVTNNWAINCVIKGALL